MLRPDPWSAPGPASVPFFRQGRFLIAWSRRSPLDQAFSTTEAHPRLRVSGRPIPSGSNVAARATIRVHGFGTLGERIALDGGECPSHAAS